ncbi:MAG: hypothetical protein JSS93_04690 [Bacteroidetes bacterium]|nr:hypothetical protein [Bacteroidota bacterium]
MSFAINNFKGSGVICAALFICVLPLIVEAQKTACIELAFSLMKNKYSRGITIYNALEKDQQESVKKMISCKTDNDMVMDLETVVHESIHYLDAIKTNTNSCPTFYLINDSELKINSLTPDEYKKLNETPVNLIYASLTADEKIFYADTYLQGTEGKQDFFFLLDELNAMPMG